MCRLTDNLYSKNTRFVFELIQNAEDNRYSEAQANNQQPFLKFTLHNDRIIIDSNEDGFREVDVQAICSTGNSTKKGSQAYIGEKGIGFKSVFKVASKVHIESGAFSFCFKHSRRDDGLGIVTPIFEDHLGLPGGVRTRMTLTLTNPHEIGFLIDEFKALPDSSLMFLSKLQVITIAIVRSADDVSETVYSYRYDDNLSRGELTKRSTARGSADVIETFYYHISKRHLSNLPADDFRPDIHEAEVVLAFPLDKDSVPLESQQYVFAFLPIRQVGYNVCRHLITSANIHLLMLHSSKSSLIGSLKLAERMFSTPHEMRQSFKASLSALEMLCWNSAAEIMRFGFNGCGTFRARQFLMHSGRNFYRRLLLFCARKTS